MRTKPKICMLLAVFLVLIALSMPLQVMYVFEHGLGEWFQVLNKLTPLNYFVMAFCIVVAKNLFEVSPSLKWTAPVLIALVCYNNVTVVLLNNHFPVLGVVLSTIVFASAHLILLRRDIREVIKDPTRRWWRSSKRYKLSFPMFVYSGPRDPVKTESFDISEGGAFLNGKSSLELEEGSFISLQIVFSPFRKLRCQARVVRKTEGVVGKYPSGLGVEFIGLEKNLRKELSSYLNQESMQSAASAA